MPDEDGISRIVGRRIIEETTKFAAIAADLSKSENHLPTRLPLKAKNIGIGIAYDQRLCSILSMMSVTSRPLVLSSWLQATVMAPTNATIKQPKKTQGDTGIGFREIIIATSAAQKGDRLNIVAVMKGWALLKPT